MSYSFIRVGGSNNLNFWSLLPCWNVTQTCTCTNKWEEIVTVCNVPYNFHLICSSQQSCEAGQASVPGSTLTAAPFPEEASNAVSMMSLKNRGHPIYNIIWISQVTNRIITPKYPQVLFQSWVSSVSQTVWSNREPPMGDSLLSFHSWLTDVCLTETCAAWSLGSMCIYTDRNACRITVYTIRHTTINISKDAKKPKMETIVLIWFTANPPSVFLLKAQKEQKQTNPTLPEAENDMFKEWDL